MIRLSSTRSKEGHGSRGHKHKEDRKREKKEEGKQEIDKEARRKKRGEKDRKRQESTEKQKKQRKEEGKKKRPKKTKPPKMRNEKKREKADDKAEKERIREDHRRCNDEIGENDNRMPGEQRIEWAYEYFCIPKDKRCERAVDLAYRKINLVYHPNARGNMRSNITTAYETLKKVYEGKEDKSVTKVQLDKEAFKTEVINKFESKLKEWDEEDGSESDEEDDSESDEGGYYPESREESKGQAAATGTSSHSTTSTKTVSRPIAMDYNYGNEQARRLYEEQLKRSDDFVQQFAHWSLRPDETNNDDTAAARRSGRN